jgi:Tfp pilus assembly protein PilF
VSALRRRARLAPLLALLASACALVPTAAPEPSLRIGDLADDGDPARRASQRLVLEGLGADARHESERARGLYQRALQVDSGNPYAYLALARQCVEQDEPELALEYVARAEDLLAVEMDPSPGAEVHLAGLRGIALDHTGETVEGHALLERAADSAPDVWGDGVLTADELR